MSDKFTTLLEKSMPIEYNTLNKLYDDLQKALKVTKDSNNEIIKNLNSEYEKQLKVIRSKQLKYIKHYFSIPQCVNYPISFTQALTKLPALYLKHVTEILCSNLNVFISNDIWFQLLCNNLKDNSSFSDFTNWDTEEQPLNTNPLRLNFEELKTLYSKELFSSLSDESIKRINHAIHEITTSPLPITEKLELLGISKTTYNEEILPGCSTHISKRLLFAISRATGYSPDYLLNLSDQATLYYSQVIPKTPLPAFFYVPNTSQARQLIAQKLNNLYTTNRTQYEKIKENNNFSDEYLRDARYAKIDQISVPLIDELGKFYNIHPLCLTGQIKKYVPYIVKSKKTEEETTTTATAAISFSNYLFNYFEAADAFSILENNITTQPYESLCNSLFLLFVYFDKTTRNMILDYWSSIINAFVNISSMP